MNWNIKFQIHGAKGIMKLDTKETNSLHNSIQLFSHYWSS